MINFSGQFTKNCAYFGISELVLGYQSSGVSMPKSSPKLTINSTVHHLALNLGN